MHLKYEKQLRNLQLQESRLLRRYNGELAELRALQAERESGDKSPGKAKTAIRPATPVNQFVFANTSESPQPAAVSVARDVVSAPPVS